MDLYFTFFYGNSFELYINGNGGFVGTYLNQNFIENLIILNNNIAYYLLVFLITIFFLLSINLSPSKFYLLIKNSINFLFKRKDKNYTDKSEIISEYIPQEEIKNLIQEDLPFIKTDKNKTQNKSNFKLPSIDLLKKSINKEKENQIKMKKMILSFLKKYY